MNLDSSLLKQILHESRRTSAVVSTIKTQVLRTKKTNNQTQKLIKLLTKDINTQSPNLSADSTIRGGEKEITKEILTLISQIYNKIYFNASLFDNTLKLNDEINSSRI